MLKYSFLSSANRKKFCLVVYLVTLSICFGSVSEGLPQPTIPRIAFVIGGSDDYNKPLIAAFQSGLADLGLIKGTDFMIDYHLGHGKVDTYPEFAKAIVARTPSCIVAGSTHMIEALMRATKTIPIVMGAVADPLASGFVNSLARPGGNVTGLSMRSPEMNGKRLELIKELLPKARRIAMFWNSTNKIHHDIVALSQGTARLLNLELQTIEISRLSDFKLAFDMFLRLKADAFINILDAFMIMHRQQFINFAARYKIPAVYDGSYFPLEGGLMSYTADFQDLYRRAAVYVKKILAGANPANLPVERARRAEFIINLKAARQIGLTVPPEMLMLADQVIE